MLKRRMVKISAGRRHISILGSGVTASFVVSTASRRSLDILPLGSISIIVITVNRGFNTSIHIITLLGGGKIGRVCTHTMSSIRGAILRTFGLSDVLAPRGRTTQDLIRLLSLRIGIRSFRVSRRRCIVGFGLPSYFMNCGIDSLSLRARFGVGVVTLVGKRGILGNLNVSVLRRRIRGRFRRGCRLRRRSRLIYCKLCGGFVSF